MTPDKKESPELAAKLEIVEEILESIWLMEERGINTENNKAALCSVVVEEGVFKTAEEALSMLDEMKRGDYVQISGDEVSFRPKGHELAKTIIRRKRLAEKLLAEVLAVEAKEIKASACRFEHILSPEVTESVCSFLGHPPSCPHGKPIPRGECCRRLSHSVRPLVMPLKDMDPGSRGRIVFIAPKDHSRMDRLSSLGIVPGTEVSLHQKTPAFVIRTGETELALDIEIAGEIYVKEIH